MFCTCKRAGKQGSWWWPLGFCLGKLGRYLGKEDNRLRFMCGRWKYSRNYPKRWVEGGGEILPLEKREKKNPTREGGGLINTVVSFTILPGALVTCCSWFAQLTKQTHYTSGNLQYGTGRQREIITPWDELVSCFSVFLISDMMADKW